MGPGNHRAALLNDTPRTEKSPCLAAQWETVIIPVACHQHLGQRLLSIGMMRLSRGVRPIYARG